MFELSSKLHTSFLNNLAIDLFGPSDFAADEKPFGDILYGSEGIEMVDSLI
jgi:hypothetical protein